MRQAASSASAEKRSSGLAPTVGAPGQVSESRGTARSGDVMDDLVDELERMVTTATTTTR